VFCKEGTTMQYGRKSFGNVGGYELLENCIDLSKIAGNDAVELLKAKSISPGKCNLIVDPLLAGTFIHEAFGHACEADGILAGDSILDGKLGSQIAPEFVTVTDGGAEQGLNGSYRYDSELCESKITSLIKDGILTSYLHNLETAGRMGTVPTGNGRSGGMFEKPIVRMSNTFLHPGDYSMEEILQELKEGYIFVNWNYGYTNPGDGMFMFKAEKAYAVENGEIMKDKIYSEAALTGNTLSVLSKIGALSKETKRSQGNCGKGGQSVPVTDGGPYMLFKDMVVG
jgi:TldD protein